MGSEMTHGALPESQRDSSAQPRVVPLAGLPWGAIHSHLNPDKGRINPKDTVRRLDLVLAQPLPELHLKFDVLSPSRSAMQNWRGSADLVFSQRDAPRFSSLIIAVAAQVRDKGANAHDPLPADDDGSGIRVGPGCRQGNDAVHPESICRGEKAADRGDCDTTVSCPTN